MNQVFKWTTRCLVFTVFLQSQLLNSKLNAQATLPETNAGKRMAQVVEAVNSDDNERRREILLEIFPDQESLVKMYMHHMSELRQQVGALKIASVKSSEENEISVEFSTKTGPHVLLTLLNQAEAPHGVESIDLTMNVAQVDTSQPLTEEELTTTIEAIARKLRSNYVFPEVGEKMAVAVESSLEQGEYKELTDRRKFCKLLTKQLREICNDKHLGLRLVEPEPKDGKPQRHRLGAVNHGFMKVEYLPSNIGYLKFNFFSGDKDAEQTAAAAMTFLAESKALIIDLRENGGGSPDMIAFLTTYLFDEGQKVHLNSFYNRPSDTKTESWIRDEVPGKRLGKDVPVFVLTSDYTFSGAEEFSYNLKHLKRGTIVGEVTGGGAHPVQGEYVENGIGLNVPFARAINPITNTNWEGTGVQPDHLTPGDKALDTAIKLAINSVDSSNSAKEGSSGMEPGGKK